MKWKQVLKEACLVAGSMVAIIILVVILAIALSPFIIPGGVTDYDLWTPTPSVHSTK